MMMMTSDDDDVRVMMIMMITSFEHALQRTRASDDLTGSQFVILQFFGRKVAWLKIIP
jgi:hypothetical protein